MGISEEMKRKRKTLKDMNLHKMMMKKSINSSLPEPPHDKIPDANLVFADMPHVSWSHRLQ